MANPSRARKRVHAIRRATDGSAFEKCGQCGVTVAIALADMHECMTEKEFKRFKGITSCQTQTESREEVNVKLISKAEYDESKFDDQPRSAFRFFMEAYRIANSTKSLWEIDREGFETWKNMSEEERQPYILKAEEVDKAYKKVLLRELNDVPKIYGDEEDDKIFCGDSIRLIFPDDYI